MKPNSCLSYGRASGDHKLREYEEMKAHNVAFEHMVRLAREKRLIGEKDVRDFNKICLTLHAFLQDGPNA